jgi:hypothetical protein
MARVESNDSFEQPLRQWILPEKGSRIPRRAGTDLVLHEQGPDRERV